MTTIDEARWAAETLGDRLWRRPPSPTSPGRAAAVATLAALALAGCNRSANAPAAGQNSTATANPDGSPGQPAAAPGTGVGPADSLAAPNTRANGSAAGDSIGAGPSTNDHAGAGGPG